jgi:DNA-binding MarR family transcriptional regulator
MPTDDVDAIVDAWARERPDLDVAPLQVLSRVTRLGQHLDSARSRAFTRHELDTWEFDVLAALRRSGDPYALSPGQLAAATLVTSGTITNRVDRLEARGLVRREPDPTDRRGVRVLLTAQGQTRVDGAIKDLLDSEREILSGISEDESATLAQLLRQLMQRF